MTNGPSTTHEGLCTTPRHDPEGVYNAVGDGLVRSSARTLLNSVSEGLGWDAPPRYPDEIAYPNRDLQFAIGQHLRKEFPGGRNMNFVGLLFWEDAHAGCVNPGSSPDWIDRLVDAAYAQPGLTTEELAVALKDRLLNDSQVDLAAPIGSSISELDALEAYFGGPGSLGASAASLPNLDGLMRGYCGVLLETPQFLLQGLAPPAVGPEPAVRVCNPQDNGGNCSYEELCNAFVPRLGIDPFTVECLRSGMVLLVLQDVPDGPQYRSIRSDELDDLQSGLCPAGHCGFEARAMDDRCVINPGQCALAPPPCDPRCTGKLGCCGDLPPRVPTDGQYTLWADGAMVLEADNVLYAQGGQGDVRALRVGTRLGYGDVLILESRSIGLIELLDETGDLVRFEARPPREGPYVLPYRYLVVSGPPALDARDRALADLQARSQGPTRRLPIDEIQSVETTGYKRYGNIQILPPEELELGPGADDAALQELAVEENTGAATAGRGRGQTPPRPSQSTQTCRGDCPPGHGGATESPGFGGSTGASTP